MRTRTVEPVFGQLETCQNLATMSRRGLTACENKWLLAFAAHNLPRLEIVLRPQPRTPYPRPKTLSLPQSSPESS